MKTPPDKTEWLNDVLRDGIADDGFTARVMAALPARRVPRARARWTYALPPAFASVGCAACWLVAAQGHAPIVGTWTAGLALLAMAMVSATTMSNE